MLRVIFYSGLAITGYGTLGSMEPWANIAQTFGPMAAIVAFLLYWMRQKDRAEREDKKSLIKRIADMEKYQRNTLQEIIEEDIKSRLATNSILEKFLEACPRARGHGDC